MSHPTVAVHFSQCELELAQRLKQLGLDWSPAPGHYVLDQSNLIECESPFQGRIFFILDLKHFLRRCETIENLQARMCWLPTWEQARGLLAEFKVDSQTIAERLQESGALADGTERLELYRLLEQQLVAPR